MIPSAHRLSMIRTRSRKVLSGPAALAFLPALVLGAFWLGGEGWLIASALGLPLGLALLGQFDPVTDKPPGPTGLDDALEKSLAEATRNGRRTACVMIELDDAAALRDRFGAAGASEVFRRIADRLRDATRDADTVLSPQPGRFAVVLAPMRHLDLEVAIQVSGRLQSKLEEPLALDGQTVYVTCSLGFVLDSQLRAATGREMRSAAEAALGAALAQGPSAIRAYTFAQARPVRPSGLSADETARALEGGQIMPWFQPQVSTDTGRVTGVEALARWQHPERGLIPPGDFLPAMQAAGQMQRLGEVMLHQALTALRGWDARGLDVPRVAVNFSGDDLRNPRLVDKIRWELDRCDLTPGRLCIEVLETVVAETPDDMVARNINGLAAMGCAIDLDDFGTGHASISSIRRFSVTRLKIDRSFVLKVDRDPEQQRMVAAILTMAERLGLDVLAEGVETAGEHAMLAQLGCAHVQGFGIARPMPGEQFPDWLARHGNRLAAPPRIGRSAG